MTEAQDIAEKARSDARRDFAEVLAKHGPGIVATIRAHLTGSDK